MPEGDTIFLAAQRLHRALAGRAVTGFRSAYPALTRVDDDRKLTERTIESVSARGKHLLVAFSGDLLLHTHMRMNGAWHLYRRGERWRRPARDMRIAIETAAWVAVGFNIPVAEFLSSRMLARHPQLGTLGPDLLGVEFNVPEALRRMRAQAHRAIADVLLNQRVMSGIGNVFKSEILFMAGVNPFARVESLPDATLGRIIDIARRALFTSVTPRRRSLTVAGGRRTTGRMHPGEGLWVYGRRSLPCRTCGARIDAISTGVDARLTYWCPQCQKET
jgi:endonuclease-8